MSSPRLRVEVNWSNCNYMPGKPSPFYISTISPLPIHLAFIDNTLHTEVYLLTCMIGLISRHLEYHLANTYLPRDTAACRTGMP